VFGSHHAVGKARLRLTVSISQRSGSLCSGHLRKPLKNSHAIRAFLIPKLHSVGRFLLAQGLAMAGNLLYGFLCVRLLSVSEYAKFAVLFGFMGSLTILLDVGVSTTLAPLIGEQIGDLQLIADYVASLRAIALRLFTFVTPIAGVAFIILVRRQHWSWVVVAQMTVALAVAAWFARVSASYGAVLILRRDRTRFYRAQVTGSLGSLTLLVACYFLHIFNIYTAVLLNLAQIIFIAATYYRRANHLLGVEGLPSPDKQRAIFRLATPSMPSTIFYAIQGQFSLAAITAFGRGAVNVASVGALGRLGQVFALFAQMNPILVEPFFARLPSNRVKRFYVIGVMLVTFFATAVSMMAFFYPAVFLWILGPKYAGLRFEAGLMVVGSALRFVAGFVWLVNSSRRFVYWWNNIAVIIGTIFIQVIFLWKGDLSTVRGVLFLNVSTAILDLLIICSAGIFGFIYGPKKVDPKAMSIELATEGIGHGAE
jgi:O-antigen/teichoic acid export membrane protein